MPAAGEEFGNLILTRRKGERITIGADLIVEILAIQGDKVRLGIRAPKSRPILRDDARQTTPTDVLLGLEMAK